MFKAVYKSFISQGFPWHQKQRADFVIAPYYQVEVGWGKMADKNSAFEKKSKKNREKPRLWVMSTHFLLDRGVLESSNPASPALDSTSHEGLKLVRGGHLMPPPHPQPRGNPASKQKSLQNEENTLLLILDYSVKLRSPVHSYSEKLGFQYTVMV